LGCFECLDGLAAGGDSIATGVPVFAALKIDLGALEIGTRFRQLLSRNLLCACIVSRSDRLPRIAHLLDRRTGTGSQRTTDEGYERVQKVARQYEGSHKWRLMFERT
jgi:hypothetical protein